MVPAISGRSMSRSHPQADAERSRHVPAPLRRIERRSVRSKRQWGMPEMWKCCLFKYVNDQMGQYLWEGYTMTSPGRSGTPLVRLNRVTRWSPGDGPRQVESFNRWGA